MPLIYVQHQDHSGMHKIPRSHKRRLTSTLAEFFSLACAGLRPNRIADDAEAQQQAAKRPRLMLPDYGRCASDPPLSFQRRNAHALNAPVETLKLAAAKPAAAQMPKTLRSCQSGPARSVAEP